MKHNKGGIFRYAVFSLLVLLLTACSTYYQKNRTLMDAVYAQDFGKAVSLLQNDAKWEKKERNKLLFYLNKGTVFWMQDDYVNSNIYFRKADYFVEDNKSNLEDAALSVLVNANYSKYLGENFEQVLIHYYGTLNYLALGQKDEALVEGKRMLEKMQRITDRYKSNNKYKRDAFAHLLLGLVYDMRREYNDAFIAYKNAYEIYKTDYNGMFKTPIPLQLKKDLLRTAGLSGFRDEVAFYEKELGIQATEVDPNGADLIVFWNNGLGPVKDENSINISMIPRGNNYVEFVNYDLGISIPFQVDNKNDRDELLSMKFIRLSFPKYISRIPVFVRGVVTDSLGLYRSEFEMAEDVNAIAFRSLEDRRARELGLTLLRVAMKQLAVYKAQKDKNNGLAAAALIYGAVSEQADTRNWQLLPYSINYSRIRVKPGKHTIVFKAMSGDNQREVKKVFSVNVKKGDSKLLTVQTIDFSGYGNK